MSTRAKGGDGSSGADGSDELQGIGYAAAMAEIETILRELESSAVDVDHLAERVQRASALITLCRERIHHAKLQVDQVVSQLDQR